jgi:exonuclease III
MGYWGHSKIHETAWRWLLDTLQPDIAFLQECVPPEWAYERGYLAFDQAYPLTRSHNWGTALYTSNLSTIPRPLTSVEEWMSLLGSDAPEKFAATRIDGWCMSAEVDVPGSQPTLAVSIYNPYKPIPSSLLEGIGLEGIRLKLNKDVWLLDVVFYFLKEHLNRPLVIGGDFNSSRLFDDPKPRGNNEFFDRLPEEGFISLHRLFHDADEQTYFHANQREHQLDYLYADSSIANMTTSCEVIPYDQVSDFSDHAPILATLDIG